MGLSDVDQEAVALNDAMVQALLDGGELAVGTIEGAFRSVLRHHFLPGVELAEVYSDRAIVTHSGPDGPISSSSQPAIMARMLAQAELRPGQRVLEIGAGTGYNAALVAYLVGAEGSVVTIDLDPDITAEASARLAAAGVTNVEVVTADGWLGTPGGSPFDRIVVTVGVWDLSASWLDQLVMGGLLVAPVWLRCGLQASVAFGKHGGSALRSRSVEPCGFLRLRGPGAGPEAYRRVGPWAVLMDGGDEPRLEVLARLLDTEPEVHPLGALDRGWFTRIGLGEDDAVNMYTAGDAAPTRRAGLLDTALGSLAVVEEAPGSPSPTQRLLAFGGDSARRRLVELIEAAEPLELSSLQMDAWPFTTAPSDASAVATISRRDFTFVIRRHPDAAPMLG